MRQERIIQATIFEVFAEHEIGRELKAISQWLDEHRGLLSLAAGDLRRHGIQETGRHGLPAEAVVRCALLKQYRQLSYEELAFHLEVQRRFEPLPGCPCRGRRGSRDCTRPSARSARQAGRQSIGLWRAAPGRGSWRAGRWCGSTAP